LREGGLAFYGGVIGGVLALVIASRLKKIRLLDLLDFLAVYVPLGQAIGRWGNFFNQEAFGTNTTLPWGMISSQTTAYLLHVPGTDPYTPVHPTFFYEFAANLVIFFLLQRIRRSRRFPGQVMLWYFLTYGVVRFFVEGIRTDSLYLGGTGLRVSQVLSAALVVVSLPLILILGRRAYRQVPRSLDDFVEIPAAILNPSAVSGVTAASTGHVLPEEPPDQKPAGSAAPPDTAPADTATADTASADTAPADEERQA
jgi:phosphatidylglycerol:prolipoprotein diacylglycerol transferase